MSKNKLNISRIKESFDGSYTFTHIPKCGGNSVKKILGDSKWPHFTTCKIKGIVGDEEFSNAFNFTVVRNPWDRLVSWYFYNKEHEPYKSISFKDWIIKGCPHHLHNDDHLKQFPDNPVSQIDWITNKKGDIMVDYIIKLETINDDFKVVSDKIGLNLSEFPNLNKSEHKNYKEYYDKETITLVSEMFKKEIEILNYTF
jgi:hypothetical protein